MEIISIQQLSLYNPVLVKLQNKNISLWSMSIYIFISIIHTVTFTIMLIK